MARHGWGWSRPSQDGGNAEPIFDLPNMATAKVSVNPPNVATADLLDMAERVGAEQGVTAFVAARRGFSSLSAQNREFIPGGEALAVVIETPRHGTLTEPT